MCDASLCRGLPVDMRFTLICTGISKAQTIARGVSNLTAVVICISEQNSGFAVVFLSAPSDRVIIEAFNEN